MSTRASLALREDELRAACQAAALPWRVRVLEETASTNDHLRDLGGTRDVVFEAVFAEKQTAGRGRREHIWDAEAGQDLTFSLALRPPLPLEQWARATQAAALAVCRVMETACGLRPGIKWPNDILICGQKICGILSESFSGEGGRFLVIGIGLNVHRRHFSGALAETATSLALALSPRPAPDRTALAAALLKELAACLDAISGEASHLALMREVRERHILLHRRVSLQTSGSLLTGLVTGLVTGLNDEGALLLALPDGGQITVTSAEQVRPIA